MFEQRLVHHVGPVQRAQLTGSLKTHTHVHTEIQRRMGVGGKKCTLECVSISVVFVMYLSVCVYVWIMVCVMYGDCVFVC